VQDQVQKLAILLDNGNASVKSISSLLSSQFFQNLRLDREIFIIEAIADEIKAANIEVTEIYKLKEVLVVETIFRGSSLNSNPHAFVEPKIKRRSNFHNVTIVGIAKVSSLSLQHKIT